MSSSKWKLQCYFLFRSCLINEICGSRIFQFLFIWSSAFFSPKLILIVFSFNFYGASNEKKAQAKRLSFNSTIKKMKGKVFCQKFQAHSFGSRKKTRDPRWRRRSRRWIKYDFPSHDFVSADFMYFFYICILHQREILEIWENLWVWLIWTFYQRSPALVVCFSPILAQNYIQKRVFSLTHAVLRVKRFKGKKYAISCKGIFLKI